VTRGQLGLLVLLALTVLGSAIAVVHAKYQSRELFVVLQELRDQRDQVDIEWGQLQLELGAWGTHGRVEKLARNRLSMRQPRPAEVVVIRH
jgi:cell division protein FtsL